MQVRLLGPIDVAAAGSARPVPGLRRKAVLAVLALHHGEIVGTDQLVDCAWGEDAGSVAANTLQSHVSYLRRVIGGKNAILARPPGYLLDLGDDATDVRVAERLIRLGTQTADPADRARRLEAALRLWRGRPLADVTGLPWLDGQAQRLDQLWLEAKRALLDADLARGEDAHLLVPDLERLARDHPFDEQIHAQYMLALYRAGRQADALAAFGRLRQRLRDELGIDPNQALRDLQADILRQSPALEPPAPAAAVELTPAPIEPVPGLVGRDAELAALHARAAAAAAGTFQTVWLGGEAGAGKSMLAMALTATLAERRWNTAWGGSPEVEGTPPAWAWVEVVRGLTSGAFPGAGADDPGHLLDGVPAPGEPLIAPFWIARAVVKFLRGCAAGAPLLIVLDDVHRAGEDTLEILRYAAAELAEVPILVVATFRPAEAGTPLRATWAALAGPRAGQLDLGGLAEPEVGRLLRQHAAVPLTPGTVRLITARTGGNPLFVGETARLIASDGVAAATELVPAGVGNLIRHRLAGLPPAARAALRTIAVLGIEAEAETLVMLDPDRAETMLDGIEAAVRAGLLTEPAPGTVRFSHVLVRDTIYHDLSAVRRVRLHASALDALERTRTGDDATLAHHALAAATPATAIPAAIRASGAARAASAGNSHRIAASLLIRALATLDLVDWPAPDSPDDLRFELLCALVSAQGHAGHVRDARVSRAGAIEVARRLGGHRRLARAYTSYDAPALWTLQDYRQTDRALIDGLQATLAATPREDEATRCALLTILAIEIEDSDVERTGRVSGEAESVARRLGDPELLCRALNARYRYVAALGPDRWPDLDLIGQEQLEVATAAGFTAYQAQAHHILCMASLGRNDLDAAQRHLDRAVGHATSGQLGLVLGVLGMFAGLRELVAGRFDQAERAYAPVIARLKDIGTPSADDMQLLVEFCIEHARGGPGTRERMAALAERARPAYERLGEAVAESYTRILIGAGELDRARAVWRPDVPVRRDYYWFRWMTLRAENAVHLGDLVVAADCYRQLQPWAGRLPGLLHAHIALGPVDHVLGDLAAALGRPGAAVRHYADAVVVAERIGAPHWAARSRDAFGGRLACV